MRRIFAGVNGDDGYDLYNCPPVPRSPRDVVFDYFSSDTATRLARQGVTVIGAYTATVLTLMGIWSIVALGLNVITGYAGQFNLGIGVYMGTGAYTAAMLTTGAGLDVWLALLCALAASAMMGFLTGLPALRVREDSLAVFTIGLVFVFESLLIYLPYFGGPVGIGRIPSVAINGIPLGKEGYLALVLAALAIIIAATLYLKRAWIGLAWASIRENELATNVIGIHPARFKLYAFTVG